MATSRGTGVHNVRMKRRPWELRRQVLWLQTATAAVLIILIWITLLSRARAQADRDAAAAGVTPPGCSHRPRTI